MGAFRIKTFVVSSANSPYKIIAAMGVRVLSYKLSTGTTDSATYSGDLTMKNASGADEPSVPITIGPGGSNTILPQSPLQPIDGITFNVTTGSLALEMAQ